MDRFHRRCNGCFGSGSAYGGPPKPCEGGILKVAAGAYPPTLDWPTSTSTATREIANEHFRITCFL